MTTRSDDNLENAGAPQNLEWVTPKISFMEVEITEGTKQQTTIEFPPLSGTGIGPS